MWKTNVAGFPNTAIHFNGANSQLVASNSGSFNFTTNSFTINLWFRPYNEGAYVMGNDIYQTSGWYLRLTESNTQVQFSAETNSTDTNTITTISGHKQLAWSRPSYV